MKAPATLASKAFACVLMVSIPVALTGHAHAQKPVQGRWAAENDPVAKHLIEQERRWGIDACHPSNVVAEFLADDFVGTSPKGMLYEKPKDQPSAASPTERDCKLLGARVRFYGPDIAVIYGRESALVKGADGTESLRTLIWTDTALRRGGKWQLIAVQDMVAPAK